MSRKCITFDEAVPVDHQPVRPCSDCPWRRDALAGWLGSMTPEEWTRAAHSEARIDCHTMIGPQCAGAAIYRANMAKKPRDPEILRLPADRERVFATPKEFIDHHNVFDTKPVKKTTKRKG